MAPLVDARWSIPIVMRTKYSEVLGKRSAYRTLLFGSVVLCLFIPVPVMPQAIAYTLGIEGPLILHGAAGEIATGTYYVTVKGVGSGSGEGVEGWSFALRATRARVTGITLSGTAGNWSHAGGSEHTALVDGSAAVSVVSLPSSIRLEPLLIHRLAAIQVEVDVPAAGEVDLNLVRLDFVDGLEDSNGLVSNTVRESNATVVPKYTMPAFSIDIYADSACVPISLGFSTELMESSTPFHGIIGGASASGEAQILVPPGETGAHHVFVNLITTFPEKAVHPSSSPAIFGWSFSIPIEGEGVCVGGTSNGTIMARYGGGFQKTECIDPQKNFGRRGVVAAFAQFFFDAFINIPPVGTYSVLDMQIAADGPQGVAEKTVRLSFLEGLVGSGQPLQNALTLDGNTVYACNTYDAAATFHFRADPGHFVRGNPNGDERVDISDAVWILGALFLEPVQTTCHDAADANDDGQVDLTDAVYILNFRFVGGRPIPPPYPDCGLDSQADDEIGCASSQVGCVPR